jgi:hypothetical protein
MHPFWTRQVLIEPRRLNAALLQLHHAAQFIAAVGQSLLPPAHDDSHINMEWLPDRELLAGDTIDDRIRIGLEIRSFSLCLSNLSGQCVTRYALDGKTLAQGYGWLKQQLDLQGFAGDRLQPIAHYELPAHPVLRGAAFRQPTPATLQEICDCYHNAYGSLTALAKQYTPLASGVRVWPHHFDMAVLIELRHDTQNNATATIGSGLAIADERVEVPYYYVRPWQQAGPVALNDPPSLPAGRWDLRDFQGAILPLDALPGTTAAAQQDAVLAFLQDATTYCRAVLTASATL